VRDTDVEDVIESNGGKVSSSVSKKTTHLVVKETGSGSSKEVKAEKLGVPVYKLEEFVELIK